jgi:hypothetical protein
VSLMNGQVAQFHGYSTPVTVGTFT